jgi:hypothetical protein
MVDNIHRGVVLALRTLCIAALAALSVGAPSAAAKTVNGCEIKARTSCPHANLRDADLSSTNLTQATLIYADLNGANLRYASLHRANLGHANLGHADLRGANLSLASLHNADLRHADLTHADLAGARFCNTTLPNGSKDNAGCQVRLSSAAATTARATPFLLHLDAYFSDHSCNHEWSAADGRCLGLGSTNPEALVFSGRTGILIRWCSGGKACFGSHTPPAGYSRWMQICWPADTCKYDLTGFVVYPNGPFTVRSGEIGRQSVAADDADQNRVGKPGGPLGLHVGYHHKLKYSYGYVFRFSGELNLS